MTGFHWQYGVIQSTVSNAITIAINIATSSSNNYENAMNCGFFSDTTQQYYPDCSDLDGSVTDGLQGNSGTNFTYGYSTATSPTRTIQAFSIDQTVFESVANATNPVTHAMFIVGAYARGSTNGSADNGGVSGVTWGSPSSITASSMSNGCQANVVQVTNQNTRKAVQDNTVMINSTSGDPQGIYGSLAGGTGGEYIAVIVFGGGRGGVTYPASGDYFYARYTLDAKVNGSTATTKVHEIRVESI